MSDLPRLLFIDQEPRLSGGQMVLLDLISHLPQLGYDVHLAVPGEGGLPEGARAAGVRIHHYTLPDSLASVSRWELAERPLSALRRVNDIRQSWWELDRLVLRVAPDLVHTNSLKAHLLAWPTTIRRRLPHVWHVQDILDGAPRALLSFAALTGAARVIACSTAVAASFPSLLRPRVRVVHNSVNQERATTAEARAFRAELGVRDDQCLVTMVGQIAEWKGQDVLVGAAERLRAREDLRFAIVGECLYPENEADYEQGTRSRSADLGPLVTWTGHVEPIAPVMAASDIIVHASRLPEPFGRVIMEAMVQGTPVISNDIGAGPELVTPEVGLLVPPNDPAALANAIARLVGDRALRYHMAAQAPSVAARYSPDQLVAGTLGVYAEIFDNA